MRDLGMIKEIEKQLKKKYDDGEIDSDELQKVTEEGIQYIENYGAQYFNGKRRLD